MKYIVTLLFSLLALNAFAQININELQEHQRETPKKMVFYLYTDWCKVCKIQDKQIEKDRLIQDDLRDHVYYFKLNAEDQNTWQLKGKTFTPATFITYYLGSSRVEFPLWLILDEHDQLIDSYTGLISAKQLSLMIEQLRKMNGL